MKTLTKRFNATCLAGSVAALTVLSGSNSLAAPLTLSDVPLFLTSGATPNLIMAIDDSGSMDTEVLFPANDGAAWWRTGNGSGDCLNSTGNSFVGCANNSDATRDVPKTGVLNFNVAGNAGAITSGGPLVWKKFVYLFPNGSGSGKTFRRRMADASDTPTLANDHFAIPPVPTFAWARAAEHNKAYFNPAVVYTPWPDGGGYTFGDSSPTAARWDAVYGLATDTIDLTKDRAGVSSIAVGSACTDGNIAAPADQHYFRAYQGMVIPKGTCMRVAGAVAPNTFAAWAVASDDISVNVGTSAEFVADNAKVAIRYFPATFYLPVGTPLPTGYGWTGAVKLVGYAPDGTKLDGYELKPSNFTIAADYDAAIQNFANWFTYYRKRHQALRAGLGLSFQDLTNLRIGGFTINDVADVTMGNIDVAADRTTLYTNFYKDWTGSGGTPNRDAVAKIISNYKRTGAGAPITLKCQRNFGMLFTDGFSNAPDSGDDFAAVNNFDGSYAAPYKDGVDDTMADGVMKAYVENPRTDLPLGQVKVPAACDSTPLNPRLDCNKNLHMNFYAVTLGARGVLFDSSNEVDPYVAPTPVWPTAFPQRHPSAVDDLWHATINGRGKLLNAKSPRDIADKLSEVLSSVTKQPASASSATVNSGSVNTESRVYQAKFSSTDWSGQLLSYKVKADGKLEATVDWDAAKVLPTHDKRNIFTMKSDGKTGIAFDWDTVKTDATRVTQLAAKSGTGTAAEQIAEQATAAEAILSYVRGSDAKEGDDADAGKIFRVRDSKLGDLVNSSPLFVGTPAFFYPDSFEGKKYSQFRADQKDRAGAVYVGGNDGMLHGFDAATGVELLAFIPGTVFGNLKLLKAQDYAHKYFVDGSPNMGDVYTNGAWRTVLIGGLNRGGQAMYALDISNPKSFDAGDVLWEFTDRSEADAADLGYTFSKPAIVRLADGNWGAVFGNGYNSTASDGAVGSGEAVLFIVNIADGKIIRKITTKQGDSTTPNGLATPTIVDIDGDSIADYAYAGDLKGNMWKFNLRNSDSTKWGVSYGTAAIPEPLYIAKDASDVRQPITGRADISRGPGGNGLMVLFGTGKYLEETDKTTKTVQTFYGIFDPNEGSTDVLTGRAKLTKQSILAEIAMTSTGPFVRSTSTLAAGARGWYMDFKTPPSGTAEGERIVSNPIYRDGRIIFTTLIPRSEPCDSGGDSWLMELDALSGSRLTVSPFDINRDGKIDAADIAAWKESGVDKTGYTSGIKSEVGIIAEPGILADPNQPREFKYTAGSLGTIQVVTESANARSFGRQSWRPVK